MLRCSICGKKFADTQLYEYAAHVQKCCAEKSMQMRTEKMKKINDELEEVKRAGVVYHGLKNRFKEKYPYIYKTNFKDEYSCNCECDKSKEDNEVRNDGLNFKLSDDEVDGLVDLVEDMFGLKFKKR